MTIVSEKQKWINWVKYTIFNESESNLNQEDTLWKKLSQEMVCRNVETDVCVIFQKPILKNLQISKL